MYHYLFTNDLRITTLDISLKSAAHAITSGTVPSASVDKSANNNINTLGFYFNLFEGSRCAAEAVNGNLRSVVLNFIKKFQFPNPRTEASFQEAKNDGIVLAPLRTIVRVLYAMKLLYGDAIAFLTKEEIKNFIFYNNNVAKTKTPDINGLIADIIQFRRTDSIPLYIEASDTKRIWKHEGRQLREMLKVLTWVGFVFENDEKIRIDDTYLSRQNKADIYEIVNCTTYWNEKSKDSYRKYMDLSEEDVNLCLKIDPPVLPEYSIGQLGTILKTMEDSAQEGLTTTAIHSFGIKYADYLTGNEKISAVLSAAGISENYATEIRKGIRLNKSFRDNSFGIHYFESPPTNLANDESIIAYDSKNILFYGIPGAGKSWTIQHEYCKPESIVRRLVFHPDYTNADFIGQILPRVTEAGQVSYEFTPGPFTTILKEAYEHPDKECILIIEELNRGNAPAIFGEVFQLLDRKKEGADTSDGFSVGTSEYGITHRSIAEFVFGDSSHKVRIPSNLKILATMNTSDQNVFTLDTAFKRRWSMKGIRSNWDKCIFADTVIGGEDNPVKAKGKEVTWKLFADLVNEEIAHSVSKTMGSEDKRMGAFFVDESEVVDRTKFAEKVLAYLWDDVFKYDLRHEAFNDSIESLENLIDTFIQCKDIEDIVSKRLFESLVDDNSDDSFVSED